MTQWWESRIPPAWLGLESQCGVEYLVGSTLFISVLALINDIKPHILSVNLYTLFILHFYIVSTKLACQKQKDSRGKPECTQLPELCSRFLLFVVCWGQLWATDQGFLQDYYQSVPKEHSKGSVFYLNGNISNDSCFELRKIYWTIFAKRFYTYLNITNCTFLSWFEDHKFSLFKIQRKLVCFKPDWQFVRLQV